MEREKVVSNPSEVSSVQTTGGSENTEGGFPEDTYNNINNTITDNIYKITGDSITDRCEDTPSALAQSATASGAPSQPLRERIHTREEIKKALNEYNSWFGVKELTIMRKYNGAVSSEDFLRMFESDEYKALLAEAEKKREALEQEYGTLFPH